MIHEVRFELWLYLLVLLEGAFWWCFRFWPSQVAGPLVYFLALNLVNASKEQCGCPLGNWLTLCDLVSNVVTVSPHLFPAGWKGETVPLYIQVLSVSW